MADMNIDEVAEALDRERAPEVAAIRSALNDHTLVGISGAAESGKTKVVRLALARTAFREELAVVRVDLDGVYSPRHLARRWLWAVARAAAGPVAFSHIVSLQPEVWPEATRRAEHHVRDVLREDYEVALGLTRDRERSKGGDADVARAMAATRRLAEAKEAVIAVDHLEAPELSGAFDVRALLWQLRALSQQMAAVRVVLVCRPGAVGLAADDEAAFYGDGVWLTVGPPTPEAWRNATSQHPGVDDVYAVTGGHFWSTLLTLRRLWNEPRRGPAQAFAQLALEHQPLAARSQQHAGTLHRLGTAILQGIANGVGPYEAIPDAQSRDIAEAARRLELAGLAHHPDRGVWRITNPFVEEALRGSSVSGGKNVGQTTDLE